MAYVRNETVGNFSEEELLRMVKASLDELNIPYEEGPGGLGDEPFLDPGAFAYSFTIKTRNSPRRAYRFRRPTNYLWNPAYRCNWEASGQGSQVLGAA